VWDTAIVYAQDGGGGAAQPGGSPLGGTMFMMVIMFAIIYFLMLRPQQKRDRQRREMLAALGKGDRVITNGGIYGTIVGLSDKTVVLKVSDDPVMKLEFARGAVSQVAPDDDGKSDSGKND